MKTLKKVEIKPVFLEFIPSKLEQGKVYISEENKISIHKCLCGCGEKVVMRLNNEGWKLEKHQSGKVTFYPSIGNYNFPCKSHYIITKNVANFV